MKRFIAVLNDCSHINIAATRMEIGAEDNAIRVWNGDELVAYVDVSTILSAYMSERTERNG